VKNKRNLYSNSANHKP